MFHMNDYVDEIKDSYDEDKHFRDFPILDQTWQIPMDSFPDVVLWMQARRK